MSFSVAVQRNAIALESMMWHEVLDLKLLELGPIQAAAGLVALEQALEAVGSNVELIPGHVFAGCVRVQLPLRGQMCGDMTVVFGNAVMDVTGGVLGPMAAREEFVAEPPWVATSPTARTHAHRRGLKTSY